MGCLKTQTLPHCYFWASMCCLRHWEILPYVFGMQYKPTPPLPSFMTAVSSGTGLLALPSLLIFWASLAETAGSELTIRE